MMEFGATFSLLNMMMLTPLQSKNPGWHCSRQRPPTQVEAVAFCVPQMRPHAPQLEPIMQAQRETGPHQPDELSVGEEPAAPDARQIVLQRDRQGG